MNIPATLAKQEEARQAKIDLNQDISDTSRKDKYKKDQKELKEGLTEDKNRYYEEQIQEMEEAGRRKDSKKLFSIINKLSGKRLGKVIGMEPVKNLRGEVLSEKHDVLNRWKEHFEFIVYNFYFHCLCPLIG